MKKTVIAMVAMAAMTFGSTTVSAQSFLSKAKASVTKAASSVEKAITIKYDAVPTYSIKAVEDGTKNADGTAKVSYYLVDQNGNIRTAEAVKAQQKQINKALAMILAKVGGGAAIGGATGGAKGAAVGAAAGAAASSGDIQQAYALKKSMSQQKKLLATYEKNFTKEGQKVSAQVDVSKVEGIDAEPMKVSSKELKTLLAKADDASTDNFLSE